MSGMKMTLCSILMIVVTGALLCSADKYEKNDNVYDRGPGSIEPKFRHKQINKVWEKALRKNLHQNKLEDLRKQLKKLDEKYLLMKKERNTDQTPPDQLKEQEMIIDKQLEDTMIRYDIIAARDGPFSSQGENFRDKRINSLWLSAMKGGHFSEEELNILKKDLLEHQRKVEEFQSTMKDHHRTGESENEITNDDRKQDPIERRTKDLEMKLKHHDINQNYQELAMKVIPEHERGGFSDHKVVQLWQEAEKSNFSPEELEIIQEELKDFETEIRRSNELHSQVLTAEKDHIKGKNKSDRKNHEELKERKSLLVTAREELQHVSKKVSNFMREFKDRLGKVGKKQEL